MEILDVLLIILAVIVGLMALVWVGGAAGIISFDQDTDGDGSPDITINLGGTSLSVVDSEGNLVPESQDDEISPNMDLCRTFTQNYPTYFFVREHNCELAGGDWVCKTDKIGCYDITYWDHATMCGTTEVQALKAACSTLGGSWTCTAIEVSCET